MEIQLFHYVGSMLFHRLFADAEKIGNDLILMPFGNQLQHLPFPGGNGIPGRLFFDSFLTFQVAFQDLFRNIIEQLKQNIQTQQKGPRN